MLAQVSYSGTLRRRIALGLLFKYRRIIHFGSLEHWWTIIQGCRGGACFMVSSTGPGKRHGPNVARVTPAHE